MRWLEVSQGFVLSEKRGLVSLFDAAPTAFEVPEFVSADAAEAIRISVKFDEIFTVVDEVLATFNEETRAEAAPMIGMARGMLEPAFAEMGPEIYVVTNFDKPLGPGSAKTLVAVPVRDELIINNTLTMISAQAPMLAPRDFEGAVIYEAPAEFGMPFALGSGFGYLMVGPPDAIENAMRSASNPGGASLGDEARFKNATDALGREMQFASFISLAERLMWTEMAVRAPDRDPRPHAAHAGRAR